MIAKYFTVLPRFGASGSGFRASKIRIFIGMTSEQNAGLVGSEHSVALTTEGGVFTWGSSKGNKIL